MLSQSFSFKIIPRSILSRTRLGERRKLVSPVTFPSSSSLTTNVVHTPSKFRSFTSSQIYKHSQDNFSVVSPSSPVYPLLSSSSATPTKEFNILGIETSCDDTAISVITSEGKILSNIIYSQYDLYQKYGGFLPLKSSQLHQARINYTLKQAILAAGLGSLRDIHAIGATRGPGLETCLKVGYFKGLELANNLGVPFVAVNHHEAHCMVGQLRQPQLSHSTNTSSPAPVFPTPTTYPFLSILVSGGHSSFYLCHGLGDFECLGTTLDDSLGESFDKVARELGLPLEKSYYDELFSEFSPEGLQSQNQTKKDELVPPGQALELMAKYYELKYGQKAIAAAKSSSSLLAKAGFKVPMKHISDCNLSFSGVKNLFYTIIQGLREEEDQARAVGENQDIPSESEDVSEIDPMKQKKQKKLVKNAAKSNNSLIQKENVISLSLKNAAYLSFYYQELVFEHLMDRLLRIFFILEFKNIEIEDVFLVGGVGSNKKLQEKINKFLADFNERKQDYIQNLIQIEKEYRTTSTNDNASPNESETPSESVKDALDIFNVKDDESLRESQKAFAKILREGINQYNSSASFDIPPSVIDLINDTIKEPDLKINLNNFQYFSDKKRFLSSSNNQKLILNKNEYTFLRFLLNNHYLNRYFDNKKIATDPQQAVKQIPKVKFNYLPPLLCTDNGVMIAWTAFEKLKQGSSDRNCVGRYMLSNSQPHENSLSEENFSLDLNSKEFKDNLDQYVKKYDDFIFSSVPSREEGIDDAGDEDSNSSFILEFFNNQEGKFELDINSRENTFKDDFYVKPRWNLVSNYTNNFMLSNKKYPF